MCRGAYGLSENERGMTDSLNELYTKKFKVDNTPSQSIVTEFQGIKNKKEENWNVFSALKTPAEDINSRIKQIIYLA